MRVRVRVRVRVKVRVRVRVRVRGALLESTRVALGKHRVRWQRLCRTHRAPWSFRYAKDLSSPIELACQGSYGSPAGSEKPSARSLERPRDRVRVRVRFRGRGRGRVRVRGRIRNRNRQSAMSCHCPTSVRQSVQAAQAS